VTVADWNVAAIARHHGQYCWAYAPTSAAGDITYSNPSTQLDVAYRTLLEADLASQGHSEI
jgi:hypothetical protein